MKHKERGTGECGVVTVCPLKGGRGEKMREGEAAVSA